MCLKKNSEERILMWIAKKTSWALRMSPTTCQKSSECEYHPRKAQCVCHSRTGHICTVLDATGPGIHLMQYASHSINGEIDPALHLSTLAQVRTTSLCRRVCLSVTLFFAGGWRSQSRTVLNREYQHLLFQQCQRSKISIYWFLYWKKLMTPNFPPPGTIFTKPLKSGPR